MIPRERRPRHHGDGPAGRGIGPGGTDYYRIGA
jgi:hypothetical protein